MRITSEHPLHAAARARLEASDRLRPYAEWLLHDPESESHCEWIATGDEDEIEDFGETLKLVTEYLAAGG